MRSRTIAGIAAVLTMLESPAHAAGGSEAFIASPSLAVQGSVASFKLASVVLVVVFELLDREDDSTERSGFRHIESIADQGSDFFISSVRYAGDIAMVSFRASIAGTAQTSGAKDEEIRFTAEVQRDAFDGAFVESGAALTTIAEGTEVPVVPVAITAGSAERLVGYSIALAADPSVVVCVMLNDVGRQLYPAPI